MACRTGCCCCCGSSTTSTSAPVNEDNARFLLLALLIVVYLLCGAAVFSALEQPKEREAKERWAQRFEHFSEKHNLSKKDLNNFLRSYEEANVAGIRVDAIQPRWDFSGALYFVGTVVSTIGEVEEQPVFYNTVTHSIIYDFRASVTVSSSEKSHRIAFLSEMCFWRSQHGYLSIWKNVKI